MISRRLLRIKVLHILYAYFNANEDGMAKFEKDLNYSLEKSYDLYHLFFLLLIDVKQYAENRIELAKNKRMPTTEDLNPNLKFVNNRVIAQLGQTSRLFRYTSDRKLNWAQNPELVKSVYNNMVESVQYQKYLASGSSSYDTDRDFVETFYTNYLLNNDLLYQILEENSIFWNDDIEFVLSMNLKTIQKAKASATDINLFDLYKNDEDREFAKKLFRNVVLKHTEYSAMIQDNVKNWDVERVAQLDMLVMEMALAEILLFPSIPVKVSFNEYLDIVKFYSTERSNAFINGVLDKMIKKLKDEGKIEKAGRGLQE
jgi:transcription antitermination protein NusB